MRWVIFAILLLVGIGAVCATGITFSITVSGTIHINYYQCSNLQFNYDPNTGKTTITVTLSNPGDGIEITSDAGYTGNVYLSDTDTIEVNIDDPTTTQVTVDGKDVPITPGKTNILKNEGGTWKNATPTKAPIPPIAVALALLTIPIIALRKLN